MSKEPSTPFIVARILVLIRIPQGVTIEIDNDHTYSVFLLWKGKFYHFASINAIFLTFGITRLSGICGNVIYNYLMKVFQTGEFRF